MNRTGIFVDVSNLYFCVNKRYGERKVDYTKFLDLALELSGNPEQCEATAFGCKFDDEANAFIRRLNSIGFHTDFYITPKNKTIALTTYLMVSILQSMERLETIVIGSANKEFLPFISYLKNKGKNVIVLACGICNEIRNVATQYLELEEDHLEAVGQPQ